MRKNDQYCVGGCNNNKRYLHNITKRAHVAIMKWHGFKSDPSKHEQWIKLTGKGREKFQPGKWTYVCSNHFIDAEPTIANPNPTRFLTVSDKKATLLRRKFSVTFKSNLRRCFIKKLFLKISQYSHLNTCVGVFFNKVAVLQAWSIY